MNLFNLDGPFFRFGNILADIMILSLLWLILSLPIITIGASTTALFYVTTRRISDRESYLIKDYFKSFKENFKKATILWIMQLAMGTLLVTNMFMLPNDLFDPLITSILFPIQIILLIELFIVSIYIFPLTARFDMKILQTIKSAFFMANRHLLTSISCVMVVVAIFMVVFYLSIEIIMIFAMGIYAYAASYMIMPLFKRYRPEIDADNLATEPLAPIKVEDEEN